MRLACHVIPKFFIVVSILIGYIAINISINGYFAIKIKGGNSVLNSGGLVINNTAKAFGIYGQAFAALQFGYKYALQGAFAHIKHAFKTRYLAVVQIEPFGADAYINTYPVGGVYYFSKVFGIAVLPPAYAGFIGIIYA